MILSRSIIEQLIPLVPPAEPRQIVAFHTDQIHLFLQSHLEAFNEIDRLRQALDAMTTALDAVDGGKMDDAIDQLIRLEGLHDGLPDAE